MPIRCSFVSANGPSVSNRSPLRIRTVVAVSTPCKPAPVTMIPASTRAWVYAFHSSGCGASGPAQASGASERIIRYCMGTSGSKRDAPVGTSYLSDAADGAGRTPAPKNFARRLRNAGPMSTESGVEWFDHPDSDPVELYPTSPQWGELADQWIAAIRRALSGLPVRLEHVGSTAVPGLFAKPV